jgi:hypothetical protein
MGETLPLTYSYKSAMKCPSMHFYHDTLLDLGIAGIVVLHM